MERAFFQEVQCSEFHTVLPSAPKKIPGMQSLQRSSPQDGDVTGTKLAMSRCQWLSAARVSPLKAQSTLLQILYPELPISPEHLHSIQTRMDYHQNPKHT